MIDRRSSILAILALGGLVAAICLVARLSAYGAFFMGAVPEVAETIQPKAGLTLPNERRAQIVIIGTSLTANGTWPDELARALSACRSAGVDVRRIAKPGASSAWGVEQLSLFVGQPKPDIVIVEFTANDASLYRGMSLGSSYRNHARILEAFAGSPVFLATMNPAWRPKALVRPGQNAYYQQYRRLSVDYGVGLIDTIATWRRLPEAERVSLVPDGIHPTAEAMRKIILPAFEAALRPLVCTL